MRAGGHDLNRAGITAVLRPIAGALAWLLALIAVASSDAHAVEVGSTVEGAVEIGGFKVPLPPGAWTAYYADDTPEEKFPVFKLGLLRATGKSIKQTVYIRVSRNPTNAGFHFFPQCSLTSYFFSVTVANKIGGEQNCWHVRPETLAADVPSARQIALVKYADSKHLFLPLTMIGSRFHMADLTGLLRVSYGWTPDLILRAPKDKKAWRFQDWTADAVAADPRKKAIMTKMQQWGEEWRPQILQAFGAKASG